MNYVEIKWRDWVESYNSKQRKKKGKKGIHEVSMAQSW